jgi:tripartite-type tricarboxylate transporter receptor subunit TctC
MYRLVARSLASLAVGAGVLGVSGVSALAADFAGKRVEITVGATEGGGVDLWARSYARVLEKNLPGKPTVLVRNIPGGNAINAANQFQSNAKPDGLNVLAIGGSTIMSFLFRDNRVKFELDTWVPFLTSPLGSAVYVNSSFGVKNANEIAKLKGKDLVYGSREATGTDLPMLLAFEMLELNLRPVFGITGRGDGRLGFERGEFNIDRQTPPVYVHGVLPMVKEGKAIPIFSFGVFDRNGTLLRDPNFPDLPTFAEVYKIMFNKDPSGPAWNAWKIFMAASYGVSTGFVLPNKTPPDIVDAYSNAVNEALNDPAVAAKLKEANGDYLQPVGSDAAAAVKQAGNIDNETKAWVQNWLTRKYGVKF